MLIADISDLKAGVTTVHSEENSRVFENFFIKNSDTLVFVTDSALIQFSSSGSEGFREDRLLQHCVGEYYTAAPLLFYSTLSVSLLR